MIDYDKITVCTTCKNRGEYLIQVLHTWKRLFKNIIIVDWSSDVPVADLVRDDTLHIVRIENEKFFEPAKAMNLAASYVMTEYVFFVNCDTRIYEIDSILLEPRAFYIGGKPPLHHCTVGNCLMSLEVFNKIGKFDKNIPCGGGEDSDLYNRLDFSGYDHRYFYPGSMDHIDHGDDIRDIYAAPDRGVYHIMTSDDRDKVTVCTTCKNRVELLIQVLPTWKKMFSNIVIVDWDSDVPVSEFITDSSVQIVRVENQALFSPTQARNAAGSLVKTEYAFFVDCDVQVFNLDNVILEPCAFYVGGLPNLSQYTTGSCLVPVFAFKNVGGYNEQILYDAGEDSDLYYRLVIKGYDHRYFCTGSMVHLDHDDVSRTKYRPIDCHVWNDYRPLTVADISEITVVSTCKNRNEFLVQALPTWKNLFSHIIVVDWSSDTPVIESIKDNSVMVVKKDNQELFSPTLARNFGCSFVKTKYVFFIDCDVLLHNMGGVTLKPFLFFVGGAMGLDPCTTGTCLVSMEAFNKVHGYNESILYEAGEDTEFYHRLMQEGYRASFFTSGALIHIEHTHVSRTMYRPMDFRSWNEDCFFSFDSGKFKDLAEIEAYHNSRLQKL